MSNASSSSDKGKLVSIILCCVGFLGVAGLHRLYVGKIGTGLIYLFTGGFFMIGTIIDVLKLASGTFLDGAGRIIDSN